MLSRPYQRWNCTASANANSQVPARQRAEALQIRDQWLDIRRIFEGNLDMFEKLWQNIVEAIDQTDGTGAPLESSNDRNGTRPTELLGRRDCSLQSLLGAGAKACRAQGVRAADENPATGSKRTRCGRPRAFQRRRQRPLCSTIHLPARHPCTRRPEPLPPQLLTWGGLIQSTQVSRFQQFF